MDKIQFMNEITSIEFQTNTENVWMTMGFDNQRKNLMEFSLSHSELNQFIFSISQFSSSTNDDNEFLWSQQISESEFLFGINFSLLSGNWIETLQKFIVNIYGNFGYDELKYSA